MPQWTRLRSRHGFNAIGVIGIAPERRGPEYLAKYVVEEIARLGRVRSGLPVCRWIDAGFCASAHTQDVRVGSDYGHRGWLRDVCSSPEADIRRTGRVSNTEVALSSIISSQRASIFLRWSFGQPGSPHPSSYRERSSARRYGPRKSLRFDTRNLGVQLPPAPSA